MPAGPRRRSRRCAGRGSWRSSLLGSVATEMLFAIALGMFARGLGFPLSLAELLVINMSVSLFASFIPVPGGIGIVEGGLAVGLTAAGLPESAAFATALLYRIATFYLPPFWGWFALQWLRKNRYLYEKAEADILYPCPEQLPYTSQPAAQTPDLQRVKSSFDPTESVRYPLGGARMRNSRLASDSWPLPVLLRCRPPQPPTRASPRTMVITARAQRHRRSPVARRRPDGEGRRRAEAARRRSQRRARRLASDAGHVLRRPRARRDVRDAELPSR